MSWRTSFFICAPQKELPKPTRLTVDHLDDMFGPAEDGLKDLGLDAPEHALHARYVELKKESQAMARLLESIEVFRNTCKWIPMEEQQKVFDGRVDDLRQSYRDLVYAALSHPPSTVPMPRRQTEEDELEQQP
jgi:hypothetical protein